MADDWSDVLRNLARVVAVAMVVGGLAAVPAALMRIDSFNDLPGWVWLFSLGWLGTYVLLPVVAFSLGRRLIGSRFADSGVAAAVLPVPPEAQLSADISLTL